MITCGFCGQSNAGDARFCVDCGKKLGGARAGEPSTAERALHMLARRRSSPPVGVRPSGAEPARAMTPTAPARAGGGMVTCSWCGNVAQADLPFCPHCGRRTDAALTAAASCSACGATVRPEYDAFCAACGARVGAAEKSPPSPKRTLVFSAKRRDAVAQLVVLDEAGEPKQAVEIDRPSMILGRADCDIAFPDDQYLSPRHAEFLLRDGALFLKDLGSQNRTWVFLEEPYALQDGDVLLIGSQLIQFRRAISHGEAGATEDGTRRIGSLTPALDLAYLAQLRADGTVRDILHLTAKRPAVLGRDTGDWIFPYDQTMSGKHAEVRAGDGAFVIEDLGSRNGVAVAARTEQLLRPGTRVLAGDQVLRVERV